MRARGFTLVEVLVTVTVIAVLMGVGLPALHAVQGYARETTCATRLRQMVVAAQAYANSAGESAPPAVLYYQRNGVVVTQSWDFQSDGSGVVQAGALWQYTSTPFEVQQCPAFEGESNSNGDPYTGYNYNTTYVGAEGTLPYVDGSGVVQDGWSAARLGTRLPQFAHPERTAAFGDGGWRSGANKYMRAPMNTVEANLPLVCAGTQAFRHMGGCTCCAYLDGHVGTVRQAERGQLTTDALARLVIGFPQNGFLSADDAAYGP